MKTQFPVLLFDFEGTLVDFQWKLKDAARDAATRAVPLATDRNLARYVTKQELAVEARSGLKAGQHLTGPSEATIALSAESAKARYGLLHKTPQALEIWRVPKGTPAKVNPALGGKAGATEATLTRPLPPRNLIRVEPLPAGR